MLNGLAAGSSPALATVWRSTGQDAEADDASTAIARHGKRGVAPRAVDGSPPFPHKRRTTKPTMEGHAVPPPTRLRSSTSGMDPCSHQNLHPPVEPHGPCTALVQGGHARSPFLTPVPDSARDPSARTPRSRAEGWGGTPSKGPRPWPGPASRGRLRCGHPSYGIRSAATATPRAGRVWRDARIGCGCRR